MRNKIFKIFSRKLNLKDTFNSLSEGLIVSDYNGKFIYFNQAAENILGIGLININRSEWSVHYGCYYPDQVTGYPSEKLPLARAIKGETITDDLIFIKNKNKPEGIFIIASASPLKTGEGTITGGIIIIRDVTESKKMEIALKQNEERFKAMFHGLPIPTFVWQITGNDIILIDFNKAAIAFTEGEISRLLNMNASLMFPVSSDWETIKSDTLKCFSEKSIVHRSISLSVNCTNEKKKLSVTYVFVSPDLVMVHVEDLTKQKLIEENIKKLSGAVEQTADSIIITDIKGIIEYVNPAFEYTTGYQGNEVIGKSSNILKSGDHDNIFYRDLWQTILRGNVYRGIIINRKKTGEHYYSEQTITPMRNEEGEITNFVSVLKDITEARKMQEKQITLNIAREIQQRLSTKAFSISGFDIAGNNYSADETSGDYFDFIKMSDGCIGIALGDVCGHGIGAALIMAETRAYLRAFAKTNSDPGIILTRLNDELINDLLDIHFVTLILVRINPVTKILDYASAGHLPGFILNSTDNKIIELHSTGIPLGIINDYQYSKSDPLQLREKELLFLYSDGIVETKNPEDLDFGIEHSLEMIRKHFHEPSAEIIEHIYKKTIQFAGNKKQEDDITAIICKLL
jgi:PAS domain S-box-containing protein